MEQNLIIVFFSRFNRKCKLNLFLLFFAFNLFGQENQLFVNYLFTNDTLQIRWVPSSPETWRQILLKGIQLKKYQIENNFPEIFVSEKRNQFLSSFKCLDSIVSKASFEYDSSWREIINKDQRTAFTFSYLSSLCKAPQENSKKIIHQNKLLFPLALKNCDLNWKLAKASGLYHTLPLKKENEKYIYEISFVAPSGKNKKVYFQLNAAAFSPLPSMKTDSIFQTRNIVYLCWEAKSLSEQFSFYDLERSVDKANFTRINSSPIVYTYLDSTRENLIYATDTSLQLPGKYYYRIAAHTYFNLPAIYSDTVSIDFSPDNCFIPKLDSLIPEENGEIKGYGSISIMNEAMNPETYNSKSDNIPNNNNISSGENRKLDSIFLSGNSVDKGLDYTINNLKESIFILKRRNPSDNWKLLNSQVLFNDNYIQFTDTSPYRVSEYSIVLKSKNSDSVFSNTLRIRSRDNVPPAVPSFTFSTINKNGIVTLSWNKNKEDDLLGYRLFRSNDTSEQALEISKNILTETQYIDTVLLNNLSPEIYYCIRAVDSVNNNSDYSFRVKLTKPDTVPPVPAQIKTLSLVSTSIKINYTNSTSRDLYTSDLYFKDETNTENYICSVYPKTKEDSIFLSNFYTDKPYFFYFKCYDNSLNISISPLVTCYLPSFLRIDTSALICIKRLKVPSQGNESNMGIYLTWETAKKKTVYSFSLYKRKIPDNFFLLKTFSNDCLDFLDEEVYLSNVYDYFLKVTYENGQNSFHQLKEPVQY